MQIFKLKKSTRRTGKNKNKTPLKRKIKEKQHKNKIHKRNKHMPSGKMKLLLKKQLSNQPYRILTLPSGAQRTSTKKMQQNTS